MALVERYDFNDPLKNIQTYQGNFQTTTKQNSKITDYFEYIYAYPPKFKIKWEAMDELEGDLFIENNYGVLEHSFPFLDTFEDWIFPEQSTEATNENYTVKQYVDGYIDKVNSSNFYAQKTKVLQNSLNTVPVFVILNGNGEIVLNKPSNNLTATTLKTYLNEKIYDVCGAFDAYAEKRQQLGLFFLNRVDAEAYLKAVAQSDIDGTKTVGLSINCIGLDSAYRITREHHPGIDFRFVPDLNEVQALLNGNLTNSDVIVEDKQQQLRFRPRTANLFPYLGKLGHFMSPSVSFLQRNEYFKGIPIYIVQVSKTPNNALFEQYFNAIGIVDVAYGKIIQSLDSLIGFGHNWIMQGSLEDANTSEELTNFIFFNKDQATEFVKYQGRKVSRFNGSRTSNLEALVKKPKIFIYNLEDYLESWEDNNSGQMDAGEDVLPNTIYTSQATIFVSPKETQAELIDFKQNSQESPLKGVFSGFGLKLRVLKRNLGVFFSMY